MNVTFIHGGDWGVDDSLVVYMQHLTNNIPCAYFAGQGCAELGIVSENLYGVTELCRINPQIPIISLDLIPYSSPPIIPRFFGNNGLNDIVLPTHHLSDCFQSRSPDGSVDLKIEDDLTWLETGPCTNLAHQLTKDGIIRNRINRIVIMGGCFDGNGLVGNVNPQTQRPYAEFNVYHDAAALERVLATAKELNIDVVIVPWEECARVQMTKSDLNSFSGKDHVSETFLRITREFFEIYATDYMVNQTEPCYSPADPIAFLAMLRLYGKEVPRWMTVQSDNQCINYGQTELYMEKSNSDDRRYPVKVYRIDNPSEVVNYLYSLFGWAKV